MLAIGQCVFVRQTAREGVIASVQAGHVIVVFLEYDLHRGTLVPSEHTFTIDNFINLVNRQDLVVTPAHAVACMN